MLYACPVFPVLSSFYELPQLKYFQGEPVEPGFNFSPSFYIPPSPVRRHKVDSPPIKIYIFN